MPTLKILLALMPLALLVPSCSSSSTSSDGSIDGRTLDTSRAGESLRDRPRQDSGPAALVCGKLQDLAGNPVAGGNLILCANTCISGSTDDKGDFCLAVDQAGEYLFHSDEKIVGSKHYVDVVFPVSISASEVSSRSSIELGTVNVPLVTAEAALDASQGGVLDLGGGVQLTVKPNSLLCPDFDDCSKIGFAEVPINKLHPRLLASRTGSPAPILAYVLVVFDASFLPSATFQTPTTISASSVTLDAFHADDQSGKLTAVGQATVVQGQLSYSMPALGWWLFY